jgi:hypothetical protein
MHDLQFARGQTAERQRIGAILLAHEAAGREALAIQLALNTTMPVAAALKALAALPTPNPQRSAEAASANSGVRHGQ